MLDFVVFSWSPHLYILLKVKLLEQKTGYIWLTIFFHFLIFSIGIDIILID